MARIVCFGAGGYLGIPLCEELVRRGHYVQPVDRFYFGKYPNVPAKPLHCDIRNYTFPEGLFDAAIDLAGLSNDATAEIDPKLTEEINANAGARLVKLAREAGVRRYIYSSSASVYGHGEKIGLTENDPVNPLTLYAKSKMHVEAFINSHIGETKFEPVILRNATVFGIAPRMRFDLAVNVMTYRAWKEQVIYVMGSGLQWRPMAHIDDIVSVFCAAIETPAEKVSGQTFNVGYENITIAELAIIVTAAIHAKIHNIPDDPDKRSYHLSFDKLRTWYNKPMKSVKMGISEILAALRNGTIDGADPRGNTLGWYKSLIEWDKRLADIRLDGKIL